MTVCAPENRSEIATDQGKAALFELTDAKDSSVDLYFGPTAPAGKESCWVKTIPGKGEFTNSRTYGPEQAAFDKPWKLGDFEDVK